MTYQPPPPQPPYQPPYYQPPYPPASPPPGGGKAIASFILGLIRVIAWCLPILGFPINLTGLVLGITDRKSSQRSFAITGIILCSIGLLLSALNGGYGAYLAITGRHPLVNKLGL